jgi:hypothetical protein
MDTLNNAYQSARREWHCPECAAPISHADYETYGLCGPCHAELERTETTTRKDERTMNVKRKPKLMKCCLRDGHIAYAPRCFTCKAAPTHVSATINPAGYHDYQ